MLRKHLLNKGSVTPLLVASAAVVLFYRVSTASGVYVRLSEAFFQAGLLSLLLGLCCIVRNGGLFKGLSYVSYRLYKRKINKQKKEKTIPAGEKEDSFVTFIAKKYAKKWASVPYFVFGGILMLLYILLLIP